jgi:hypothetical protein
VARRDLYEWAARCLKLKEEKLKHYSERELRTFFQIDVQDLAVRGRNRPVPDEDRYHFTYGSTRDLMRGASVRILIPPGQSKEDVVTMLKKVVDGFQNFGYGEDHVNDIGIPF